MLKKIRTSILPTDDVPKRDLVYAVTTYERCFTRYMNIRILKKVLELSAFPYRFIDSRKQYLADSILEEALQMRSARTQIVIVLTAADIYTEKMNYVFGLATFGSALISSARIQPSFWRNFESLFHYVSKGRPFFEQQYAKVLLHEVGHALGLPHCVRWDCAMHYSNSPIELYRKGEKYCDWCQNLLLSSIRKLGSQTP